MRTGGEGPIKRTEQSQASRPLVFALSSLCRFLGITYCFFLLENSHFLLMGILPLVSVLFFILAVVLVVLYVLKWSSSSSSTDSVQSLLSSVDHPANELGVYKLPSSGKFDEYEKYESLKGQWLSSSESQQQKTSEEPADLPPTPTISTSTDPLLVQVRAALMRRAMCDVLTVIKMRDDEPSIIALHGKGLLPPDTWTSFLESKEEMETELQAVVAEAEVLKAGWGESIFEQASKLCGLEKRKEFIKAAKEKKKAEEERVEEERRKAAVEEEQEHEEKKRQAERMAAELIHEEEQEQKRTQIDAATPASVSSSPKMHSKDD